MKEARKLFHISRLELAAILLGTFILGAAVGVVTPYLIPKETIYDKLRAAHIYISGANSWNTFWLQYAQTIAQAETFAQFQEMYQQQNAIKAKYDFLDVNINSDIHVVWMENWNYYRTNLTFIGFYFYTEPD